MAQNWPFNFPFFFISISHFAYASTRYMQTSYQGITVLQAIQVGNLWASSFVIFILISHLYPFLFIFNQFVSSAKSNLHNAFYISFISLISLNICYVLIQNYGCVCCQLCSIFDELFNNFSWKKRQDYTAANDWELWEFCLSVKSMKLILLDMYMHSITLCLYILFFCTPYVISTMTIFSSMHIFLHNFTSFTVK